MSSTSRSCCRTAGSSSACVTLRPTSRSLSIRKIIVLKGRWNLARTSPHARSAPALTALLYPVVKTVALSERATKNQANSTGLTGHPLRQTHHIRHDVATRIEAIRRLVELGPIPVGKGFRTRPRLVTLTHASIHLDRDFYWLYDRWAYSRTLGWRHDLLFGSAAQWGRRLRGTVVRIASVKMTETNAQAACRPFETVSKTRRRTS